MKKNFRHEYKYICSQPQTEAMKSIISKMMKLDSHVSPQGYYHIRSLYFDDAANTAYYENENGIDPREKFRIRMYDLDTQNIQLELKRKEHGMTEKLSCPLSCDQAERLANGETLPINACNPPLLNRFLTQLETKRLIPIIIVDYNRIPYTYIPGNVRITFDMNISSSGQVSRFLEPVIAKRPIMSSGQNVLEMKWDYVLPEFIKSCLQMYCLRRISISKYYYCRQKCLAGGNRL